MQPSECIYRTIDVRNGLLQDIYPFSELVAFLTPLYAFRKVVVLPFLGVAELLELIHERFKLFGDLLYPGAFGLVQTIAPFSILFVKRSLDASRGTAIFPTSL